MHTYKTITLGLMALFSIPALARLEGYDHCIPVSYGTFENTRITSELPQLGLKGIYVQNKGGDCVYVEASADSDFAKDHSLEYDALLKVVADLKVSGTLLNNLEFLSGVDSEAVRITPRDANPDSVVSEIEGRQANCQEVCNST